jgi:hypothetical protein
VLRERHVGRGECGGELVDSPSADECAGGGEQVGLRALGDDPAVADDDDVVGDDLDFVQQM